MYNLWSKLTTIEDVLIVGDPDEIIEYLKAHYFTPVQQIRAMYRERAAQFKQSSFQEPMTNSRCFCLLPESESKFDPLCNYIGVVLSAYEGKNSFSLNDQKYHRGDILIKDIDKIPKSSSAVRAPIRNPEDYNNLFKSLVTSSFKQANYDRFEGVGFIYEHYKWRFDAFIIGRNLEQAPFSSSEKLILEMYVLSWTKNMNDRVSIRDDARKMLDEQLQYVRGLLKTQRDVMEKIRPSQEVEIAMKTFEHESEDEIELLFQTTPTPTFNTFAHLRDKIQSKQQHQLSAIAETFEHHRSTGETQSDRGFAELSLYEVWTQLKSVENWLRAKDFHSLANFLNSQTFISIESLFSAPVPLFLNQLGICPESDIFDPTFSYIGLIIYLYSDQEEFTLNDHQCKCGQLFILKKETFCQFVQAHSYRQTSFQPLFIHECLYEWYFREKPTEHFQGIGFVYEQNQWKFDSVSYAGKYGIYSKYESRDGNPMASSSTEQHAIDLILSTIYIHNAWKKQAECMHTINDLQSIGRVPFQREVEFIDELCQMNADEETSFDEVCQLALKNFLNQYRPKPIIPERKKIFVRAVSHNSQLKVHTSVLNETKSMGSLSNNPEQTKTIISSNTPELNRSPLVHSKPKASSSSNFGQPRQASSSETLSSCDNSVDPTEAAEVSPPNDTKAIRRNSVSTKEKKEKITFYQLWRELKEAEQKLLCSPDLTQFLDYLTKKQYLNYSQSVRFIPPDNQADEYNLMGKIKIQSQLEFLQELFKLKRTKLLRKQNRQVEKDVDNLFSKFRKYYNAQIKLAK